MKKEKKLRLARLENLGHAIGLLKYNECMGKEYEEKVTTLKTDYDKFKPCLKKIRSDLENAEQK